MLAFDHVLDQCRFWMCIGLCSVLLCIDMFVYIGSMSTQSCFELIGGHTDVNFVAFGAWYAIDYVVLIVWRNWIFDWF